MTEPRSLLHRLLEYIIEQARDIDPRSFRLTQQRSFLKRPEDLQHLPGVELNLQETGDHTWLRVQRLEPGSPPPLPAAQNTLIVISPDPDGPPPMLDEVATAQYLQELEQSDGQTERSGQSWQIRENLERLVETYREIWVSWAAEERLRRRTIALYTELFSLQHQLESEETAKPQELVWGMGIAVWHLPHANGPIPLEYPVLSQAMEINLDERSMAIELRPRATDTALELDPYLTCQLPGITEVEAAAREQLARTEDHPVTPFDLTSHRDILQLFAASLDSEGVFRQGLEAGEALPEPDKRLVVTDRWALFVRPRATSYLSADVQRLQAALLSGVPLPGGPLALVTPPGETPVRHAPINYRGVSSRGNASLGTVQDLFFPLPYNQEQITIVQRLERSAGVAVQGPPGTGKTHTIANIICHYLATGRRVLVTARGETALRVLQQKIPVEVRPLTVSLLNSDRKGIRQFEAAISIIQHRLSQLQPEQTREELKVLRATIEAAHADIEQIDGRIDAIALQQLSEVLVDNQLLSPRGMAERVQEGQTRHAWFDDDLLLVGGHPAPLSAEEESALRAARRRLGNNLPYVQLRTPASAALPSPGDIASLHELLAQIRRIEDEVKRGELLPLQSTTPAVLTAAQELVRQMETAAERVARLEAAEAPWALALRLTCRNPAFASELAAFEALFGDIAVLVAARLDFLKRPVEVPEAVYGAPRTREALARAAETGKALGLLSLGAGEIRQHLAAVRVAGLAPASAQDWQHVMRFVNLRDRVHSFTVRWNQFAGTLGLPPLDGGLDALRDAERIAVTAQLAHSIANQEDVQLPRLAQAVFARVPEVLGCASAHELTLVREDLVRHLTRSELAQALAGLGVLQAQLSGAGGSISARMRGFIDSQLGNPDAKVERVLARYGELLAELRGIEAMAPELETVRLLAQRIEDAGAVRLANRLRSVEISEGGDGIHPVSDPALPADWREAWTWSRMHAHLTHIEARTELVELAQHRREVEGGLTKLYRQLVSKAAWLATKENASPKVLQALAGYALAIRRIGQGTGPNALRYRRDAREAMLDAADAVPCWVMNHARVSESLPAELGRFDLVVVDEASQSDLWALPAVLRGKKILVVGDDRQVSPDGGFISSERIQELSDRFLTDQPFGTEMTPEKSLYDLAARVFAAEQVMLREHFRCVPPIIAYSNRTFYGGAIQPLRVPTQSERIDPPLVDILVEGGVRDSKDRNMAEAEAITAEIKVLLRDERYKGRTIGVVSLLGIEQAKAVDAQVRLRLSPLELHRCQFACGDARTFQGSERDILFLSMVVDPSNARALSGAMFDQRFNVAASRARDRMYLVRSVQAADLSTKDLRLSLLQHFDQPEGVPGDSAAADQPERLIDRCETRFEREVFSALVAHGFRVLPQVQAGAHRLDMVVEGANDLRLAIECDGDDYHGPERWMHDVARQRVLERAGWTFWRCFAATWITQREAVLEQLLGRLAQLGITPLGAFEQVPALVEHRRWRLPA